MHRQPYLTRMLGDEVATTHFPVAEEVGDRFVSLPLYPGLTDADVDRVCAEIVDVQHSHAGGRR